jgi:hypothetical protein
MPTKPTEQRNASAELTERLATHLDGLNKRLRVSELLLRTLGEGDADAVHLRGMPADRRLGRAVGDGIQEVKMEAALKVLRDEKELFEKAFPEIANRDKGNSENKEKS